MEMALSKLEVENLWAMGLTIKREFGG